MRENNTVLLKTVIFIDLLDVFIIVKMLMGDSVIAGTFNVWRKKSFLVS